jgi:hypothetical protein
LDFITSFIILEVEFVHSAGRQVDLVRIQLPSSITGGGGEEKEEEEEEEEEERGEMRGRRRS